MTTEISIRERKDALRKQAHANRNAQEHKDDLSRRIVSVKNFGYLFLDA